MAYSKVVVVESGSSRTIMDVTQDTVTASNLFKNITATKADGTKATGTVETVVQATPVAAITNSTGIISATATQSAGVVVAGTKTGTAQLTVQTGTTITPTESAQVAVASYRWTTGTVTVAAVPIDTSSTLTTNGTHSAANGKFWSSVTVSIPATTASLQTKTETYTPSTATQTATITPDSSYDGLSQVTVKINPMPSGTAGTPTAIKVVDKSDASALITPSVTNTTGYITGGTITGTPFYVTVSELVAGNSITADDSGEWNVAELETLIIPSGTAGTPSAVQGSVSNNRITITPTVTNTAGYIAGGTLTGTAVTISASSLVSGTYSVSASGNHNVTNYATASVPAGTAGTPVATKGAVSNHAISVTPTVTNTTGWITGGTKNGTAITVSVSELVSGTLTITENGTVDVTNYASATISVEGGGSSGGGIQLGTKTTTPTSASSTIQFTGLSGNPTSFVVTSQADIATNTNGVTGVVFDGSALHGQTMTTQVTADTGFTKSYSNGTLTITATSAQFRPNAYKLVYTYGGSTSDIHTADVQVGSGATSITFPVNGRPAYWSCIFKSDFSTSSGYQRVIVVVNDGSSIYGLEMDSSAHAATSWSATYNGGNLTISSQGTNSGGYFHQPGYYQLTYYVDESAPQYQARTITPSTATQTVLPESGYDALSKVTVNPIPSNYIIPTGNITISANGTNINVAQYSTATVNVPTGGGSTKNTQVVTTAANYIANTTYTAVSGQTLTVSKTGTYDVLWVAWRSSTSSATYYGTQLYIDNTAHGTANTTWTGTGGQQNHLTNVSLSQGDVLTVRARSRGTSYRTYVANLTIIEQ